jgi:hypothetical protein
VPCAGESVRREYCRRALHRGKLHRGEVHGAIKNKRTGETSMATRSEQQQKLLDTPDTSSTHKAPNELIKLIRKLRWMGMEEEAKGLQQELTRRHATTADSVLATPAETD